MARTSTNGSSARLPGWRRSPTRVAFEMLAPDAEAEESITASGHRRWCRRPSVEHSCPGLSHSAPRLTVFLAPDSMSRTGPTSDLTTRMNLISQITTKLSVSTERLHLCRLNSGILQPITVDQNKTFCLLIWPSVQATVRQFLAEKRWVASR